MTNSFVQYFKKSLNSSVAGVVGFNYYYIGETIVVFEILKKYFTVGGSAVVINSKALIGF
jgi:hypothetical protein